MEQKSSYYEYAPKQECNDLTITCPILVPKPTNQPTLKPLTVEVIDIDHLDTVQFSAWKPRTLTLDAPWNKPKTLADQAQPPIGTPWIGLALARSIKIEIWGIWRSTSCALYHLFHTIPE